MIYLIPANKFDFFEKLPKEYADGQLLIERISLGELKFFIDVENEAVISLAPKKFTELLSEYLNGKVVYQEENHISLPANFKVIIANGDLEFNETADIEAFKGAAKENKFMLFYVEHKPFAIIYRNSTETMEVK